MKRIAYIFATLLALTLIACGGPKVDEVMVEMDNFMSTQDKPGLYRKSKVEYTLNKATDQCYLNPSKLTFRIMDESGNKYLQFTLSAAPVVGETVDVVATSYGLGLSSNTTYTDLTVEKIENNLCTLRSTAEGGYIGIVLPWIE